MSDTFDGLPDDPKQADIDAALAHVADGLARAFEPGQQLPLPVPPDEPAVELYDQDRRIFAEGTFYGQTLTVDVDAESAEGRAISKGALDGLAMVEGDPAPLPIDPDPHAGLGLQGAARMLAHAVRLGMAEVRSAGSDGGGRTIWRVTGLGPNIVHFGQAHVREALERRWLIVGAEGKLFASPMLTGEVES